MSSDSDGLYLRLVPPTATISQLQLHCISYHTILVLLPTTCPNFSLWYVVLPGAVFPPVTVENRKFDKIILPYAKVKKKRRVFGWMRVSAVGRYDMTGYMHLTGYKSVVRRSESPGGRLHEP